MFLSSQCCVSLGKWGRAVLTIVSWVSGCLLGVEAISLHFTYFSKLWMEVYQKAGEVSRFSGPNKSLFSISHLSELAGVTSHFADGIFQLECLIIRQFFEFLQNGTTFCNFEEFVHPDLKTCALHLLNDRSSRVALINGKRP